MTPRRQRVVVRTPCRRFQPHAPLSVVDIDRHRLAVSAFIPTIQRNRVWRMQTMSAFVTIHKQDKWKHPPQSSSSRVVRFSYYNKRTASQSRRTREIQPSHTGVVRRSLKLPRRWYQRPVVHAIIKPNYAAGTNAPRIFKYLSFVATSSIASGSWRRLVL